MFARQVFHSRIWYAARGKGFEGQAVQALEHLSTADAEFLHGTVVDLIELLSDRVVQLSQGEEGAVPEDGQDPPLGDENRNLHLRLVQGDRMHPVPQLSSGSRSSIPSIPCEVSGSAS